MSTTKVPRRTRTLHTYGVIVRIPNDNTTLRSELVECVTQCIDKLGVPNGCRFVETVGGSSITYTLSSPSRHRSAIVPTETELQEFGLTLTQWEDSNRLSAALRKSRKA